ncbi:P-loop containing nucleoside triphosphate hydrolase protein [Lentinula lateritia]|nr:P-loop containing nucleoside triphosphate hydrolase protein [Lentinula lateritia]
MHRWRFNQCNTLRRLSTSSNGKFETVINIRNANVYRFGDGKYAQPLFRDLTWTVEDGENWAVIGSGGGGEKTDLLSMLLGRYRIAPYPPPPGGLFPFLSSKGLDPYSGVSIVTFGHRQQAGGAFYDYSARYGAVHEEDRLTLRQNMFPETIPPLRMPYDDLLDVPEPKLAISEEELASFNALVTQLGLDQFLDLPLIALSNGQTRRARILKAILNRPHLLLLDEPLTGLDVKARPLLSSTLHDLHSKKAPRMILGLRAQDSLPDWVDHVAYVKGSTVIAGEREYVLGSVERGLGGWHGEPKKNRVTENSRTQIGRVLIDLKSIKVQYGDRKVLDQLSWKIRQGERWHLIGENGSGKTTLLSLITGDHPQSYTQTRYLTSDSVSRTPSENPRETSSHLELFSQLRSRLPTTLLRSAIAIMSPELFDAFPRRSNMTVWDVIGTGFDGDFVPKGKKGVGSQAEWDEEENWRVGRVWEVLHALGPEAWERANVGGTRTQPDSSSQSYPSVVTRDFAKTSFPSLPLPQQRIVLLMRALVGRAPLILLDEVWSGMDEIMVRVAREYLRGDSSSTSTSPGGGGIGADQAVVVITHWEEEVPWSLDEDPGVFKRFRLGGGKGLVEE